MVRSSVGGSTKFLIYSSCIRLICEDHLTIHLLKQWLVSNSSISAFNLMNEEEGIFNASLLFLRSFGKFFKSCESSRICLLVIHFPFFFWNRVEKARQLKSFIAFGLLEFSVCLVCWLLSIFIWSSKSTWIEHSFFFIN